MTQGVGQARVPTTRFPLTESPNLEEEKEKPTVRTTVDKRQQSAFAQHICGVNTDLSLRTTPSMQAPNKTTLLRSGRTALRKTTRHSDQIKHAPVLLSLNGIIESVVSTLAGTHRFRIQMMEVVRIARMVPTGMERWASFKSPERLDPAMIPERRRREKRSIEKPSILWLF